MEGITAPHIISHGVTADYIKPHASICALFHKLCIDKYPYFARLTLSTTDQFDIGEFVPEGMEVINGYRYISPNSDDIIEDYRLAEGNDSVVLLEKIRGAVWVYVAATSMALATELAMKIKVRLPNTPPTEDHIGVTTWNYNPKTGGGTSQIKNIKAPTWEDIKRNYTPLVVDPLAELMTVSSPDPEVSGKLVLWHGPPGTGKTTALRALGKEWAKWCSFHYITDPEELFQRPGYLMEVAAHTDETWRILVAEDTDRFLRPDSKNETGALGRLLNFVDGILGQGSKTIILLTTNEPLKSLHKAVIRPGRCLSQIEFPTFKPDEAQRWFSDGYRPAKEMTLAEMVERNREQKQIVNQKDKAHFGFGAI